MMTITTRYQAKPLIGWRLHMLTYSWPCLKCNRSTLIPDKPNYGSFIVYIFLIWPHCHNALQQFITHLNTSTPLLGSPEKFLQNTCLFWTLYIKDTYILDCMPNPLTDTYETTIQKIYLGEKIYTLCRNTYVFVLPVNIVVQNGFSWV